MTNDYITNETDILISRLIELEKEKYLDNPDEGYNNFRASFYKKMSSKSKYIAKRKNILYPWFRLFDETLFLVYELYNMYIKQKQIKVPAMLLNYIFKLLNSMKILFHSGYMEQGLIIYRTVVENIHVELVSIVDLDFSKNLAKDDEDPNRFWRENISNRKIINRLKEILDEIKIRKELIILGKNIFESLSEYVHPSVGTPLMIIEPLAITPNLLSDEPFGVINFHMPSIYIRVIQSNLEFILANIRLIDGGKTWFENTKIWKNDLKNIRINYNAVSKCFYGYYLPQFGKKEELWNLDQFIKV